MGTCDINDLWEHVISILICNQFPSGRGVSLKKHHKKIRSVYKINKKCFCFFLHQSMFGLRGGMSGVRWAIDHLHEFNKSTDTIK